MVRSCCKYLHPPVKIRGFQLAVEFFLEFEFCLSPVFGKAQDGFLLSVCREAETRYGKRK